MSRAFLCDRCRTQHRLGEPCFTPAPAPPKPSEILTVDINEVSKMSERFQREIAALRAEVERLNGWREGAFQILAEFDAIHPFHPDLALYLRVRLLIQERSAALARADKAEREVERLTSVCDLRNNQRKVAEDFKAREKARADRLAKALREAPHAMGCGATLYYGANEARYGKCNCWKAAALKPEEEKP